MKGRRHTPEQVVRKLREADRLLGEGFELPDVLKELEAPPRSAAIRTGHSCPTALSSLTPHESWRAPSPGQQLLMLSRPRSPMTRLNRPSSAQAPPWTLAVPHARSACRR